jgi:hypothetical protein
VFGNDAKIIFQDLLWKNSVKDPKRPLIVYRNVVLDAELVTYTNSKLSGRSYGRLGLNHSGIRHLVIYVPHPRVFIPNNAALGDDDYRIIWKAARRMDASLDYATRFIGIELPDKYFWHDLVESQFHRMI